MKLETKKKKLYAKYDWQPRRNGQILRKQLSSKNLEEIEYMNRQITHTEIETVINKLPTNKSSGPEGFTGEFYRTFRKELTPILLLLLLQLLSRFSRV